MFRKMALTGVLLVLVCCALPSWAEEPDCTFTFASGPGDPNLQFCVSSNGNLVYLEMSNNFQVIGSYYGDGGKQEGFEGYGLCNESPPMAYSDFENNSNGGTNWGTSTILSQSATSVKIARTTNDGVWTLTQTFTADKTTPAVNLVMSLKNNTKVARVAYLTRWVGVNATNWNYSSTHDRAFAWNASTPVDQFGFGLMLQNQGMPQFGFMNTYVWTEFGGGPPNPCNFAGGAVNVPLVNAGYASMAIAYVDTVAAKKSKKVTLEYNGMY
ncbi:MAG: hypothetical protein WA213_00105 [Terriglobales bacterium]